MLLHRELNSAAPGSACAWVVLLFLSSLAIVFYFNVHWGLGIQLGSSGDRNSCLRLISLENPANKSDQLQGWCSLLALPFQIERHLWILGQHSFSILKDLQVNNGESRFIFVIYFMVIIAIIITIITLKSDVSPSVRRRLLPTKHFARAVGTSET